MKIEKVNENQIRCVLSKKDLSDRKIKFSELAYGSEKARGLFRDMIEQANYEFGFEADDIPLMIEAIPLSGENIILQITKVEELEEEAESPIFPRAQSEIWMFDFKDLETIERLARILVRCYDGENDLYKDERNNIFCLVVKKGNLSVEKFNNVCNVISEYALKKKYVSAREAYCKEHGKVLVKREALQVLGKI